MIGFLYEICALARADLNLGRPGQAMSGFGQDPCRGQGYMSGAWVSDGRIQASGESVDEQGECEKDGCGSSRF